jgi:DNA-directed RNA polymerase beta subunit
VIISADIAANIPGLNIFVVFCNMDLTYKDGIVLLVSAAAKFSYYCVKTVWISSRNEIPNKGAKILPFSVPWWQVSFEGTVIELIVEASGQVRIRLEFIGFPVNGDKFTTLHGQKGVATILPDEQMPMVNGKIAEMVIGSSAVMKRQTASQVLEAACGAFCVERSIEHCTMSATEVMDVFQDEYRTYRSRDLASAI